MISFSISLPVIIFGWFNLIGWATNRSLWIPTITAISMFLFVSFGGKENIFFSDTEDGLRVVLILTTSYDWKNDDD